MRKPASDARGQNIAINLGLGYVIYTNICTFKFENIDNFET